MAIFSASEVIRFAVRIEENGEEFYRSIAKKFKDGKIVETFNSLADQEIEHKKTFQEILSTVEDYKPAESYPGEYFAYLKAYVDGLVFNKEKKGRIAVKKMKTVKETIQFAMGMEIESILYYLEAKNLVPDSPKKIIDRIVQEERRHYLNLSNSIKVK